MWEIEAIRLHVELIDNLRNTLIYVVHIGDNNLRYTSSYNYITHFCPSGWTHLGLYDVHGSS